MKAPEIGLLLLFIGAIGLRAAVNEQASSTSGKTSLPLRIVVLPFENASGDAGLDDWRQAWPGLVRTFLKEATSLEAPGSKRIKPAWERGGWNDRNNRAEAARSIGLDLKAKVVVWGQISRRTSLCVAKLSVLRIDSAKSPVEMEILSSNWVALAESTVVRLTEHFGQTYSAKDLAYWRSQLPASDKATALLGSAIALEIAEAPRPDQEKVVRELLRTDPQCAYAYSSLLHLFMKERQTNDFGVLAAEFLQRRPDICSAHLAIAEAHRQKGEESAAEREIHEALRRHAGCQGATRAMFALATGQQADWDDTLRLLEESFRLHPNDEQIRIFLASARAFKDDVKGARELLGTIEELPPEDEYPEYLDQLLFKAALWTDTVELVGLELLRLGPRAATNTALREEMAEITFTNRAGASLSTERRMPPRTLTSAALRSELEKLLSPDERALVVNPVEITPELVAEAQRLTMGLPNEATRIIALFSEVSRRGRGRNEGPRHTASEALKASRNAQNRFVCQEYAKLFVGLARAVGVESWLVHIDRDAFGYPCYHDCAAILIAGEVVLVDPTWRSMFIPHQEFSVLDDVQAISHHLMQSSGHKPDPRRLRAGLKLNPNDHWTRVQFVRQMADAGELAVAEQEMKKLEREPEKWDVHLASANLHEIRLRWNEAIGSLKRALALSPSNAVVHVALARVYDQVGNSREADKHMAVALELDRGEISSELRESAAVRLALGSARSGFQSGRASSQQTLVQRAEAGDAAAQVALGQMTFDKGDVKEALDWLRKAADQGGATAQSIYAKGLIAAHGKEAVKDALMWLTRAAEQGSADAQHDLGLMFYEGKLVPEDMAGAYTWMSLAAAQQHQKARSLLRYMEIFIRPDDLAEARKRAAAFTPKKKATP